MCIGTPINIIVIFDWLHINPIAYNVKVHWRIKDGAFPVKVSFEIDYGRLIMENSYRL